MRGAVGYRDHREVYRRAKHANLLDVYSEQLVAIRGWILTCQGHATGEGCEISWDL